MARLAHDFPATRRDFQQRTDERQALLARQERDLTIISERRRELEQDHSRLQALEEQLLALTRLVQEHERRRAALLEGSSISEVEQALERQREEREQELSRARLELASATQAFQDGELRLQETRQKEERLSVELARARTEHEEHLIARGFSLEQAEQLFAWPTEQAQKLRAELSALRDALTTAEATLLEREQACMRHEQHPQATQEPREELLAQRQKLMEDEQALERSLEETRLQLRQDEQLRRRRAELQQDLEHATAKARIWETLDRLIGSSEGTNAAFVQFVQGLTLQEVIARANEHLRELAPRYRLTALRNAPLELQVLDRDLGDEPRALHGLSGGESFLASLALALGLSDTAARGTHASTLFIDEGFGTLDEDAVDTVVVALQALQLKGKQIGIVSHLPKIVQAMRAQVHVEHRGHGKSVVHTRG